METLSLRIRSELVSDSGEVPAAHNTDGVGMDECESFLERAVLLTGVGAAEEAGSSCVNAMRAAIAVVPVQPLSSSACANEDDRQILEITRNDVNVLTALLEAGAGAFRTLCGERNGKESFASRLGPEVAGIAA